MSDPTQEPQNGAARGNGPDAGDGKRFNVLPINVLAQYVKDLSFENPNAPNSLMNNQATPQVSIHVDVKAASASEQGVYEVTLTLKAEATTAESTIFIVELSYAGLFSLPGVPPEHHHPVVMIECPRLLFPFARSIVADTTREGGYPPLMLNPIDFADLYRRQAANAAGARPTNLA